MIFVRGGLEAPDLFRGLSQELAHAHLDKGDYKRSDNAFVAYCCLLYTSKDTSEIMDFMRSKCIKTF